MFVNAKNNALCSVNNSGISFNGMSLARMYSSSFDFMAADILLKKGKTKYSDLGLDNSMLSANNIDYAMQKIYSNKEKLYGKEYNADYTEIKWKNYVEPSARKGSVEKINEARKERLQKWAEFLENPEVSEDLNYEQKQCIYALKHNEAAKFVIWDAVTSELGTDNRHIPIPLGQKALAEALLSIEKIAPMERSIRCGNPTFLEIYTNYLRKEYLYDEISKNPELTNLWVKIPSQKHDPQHFSENIRKVEVLSNKNWCTRSAVDKAKAVLEDGDFYIFLQKNTHQMWDASLGVATSKGKINQIQGPLNDGIIPTTGLQAVEKLKNTYGLTFNTNYNDEGPQGLYQYVIARKLAQSNSKASLPNLKQAVEKQNVGDILLYLGIDSELILADGTIKFVIDSYKPTIKLNIGNNVKKLFPLSVFGIDENVLMKNIALIKKDLYLADRNFVSNFDFNLLNNVEVQGKVLCTYQQYENMPDDVKIALKGKFFHYHTKENIG